MSSIQELKELSTKEEEINNSKEAIKKQEIANFLKEIEGIIEKPPERAEACNWYGIKVMLTYQIEVKVFQDYLDRRLVIKKDIDNDDRVVYHITLINLYGETWLELENLHFDEFKKILNHIVNNGWTIPEE